MQTPGDFHVPHLDTETFWRIGICSKGGKLAGTAFLIRRCTPEHYIVVLEQPAPVPGGLPDDFFVLAPDGDSMKELVDELAPIWLPLGQISELAYKRHFPRGLPVEEF